MTTTPLPLEGGTERINRVGLVVLALIVLVAGYLTLRAILPTGGASPKSADLISASIERPAAGDTIGGNAVSITVRASSPDGVASVEIWARHKGEWTKLTTLTNSPYTFVWNTSSLAKPYAVTLTVHVTDKKGNTAIDPGGWREDIVLVP